MAKSKKVVKTECEKIIKITKLLTSYSIPLTTEEVNKKNYHVIKFIQNNSAKFGLRILISTDMKMNNILADLMWEQIKDFDKNIYELEQKLISEIRQKYADEIKDRINILQKSKDDHNQQFTSNLQNKIDSVHTFGCSAHNLTEGRPIETVSNIFNQP